jgi:hypothetical protein
MKRLDETGNIATQIIINRDIEAIKKLLVHSYLFIKKYPIVNEIISNS